MTKPNWTILVKDAVVEAKPDGIWTHVCDYVAAPRRLRFRATGTWKVSDNAPCGPDGRHSAPVSTTGGGNAPSPILAGCLTGSLIAKIGGGTADASVPSAGTAAPAGSPFFFPIGSFCTIDVPSNTSGALFLTMNDAVAEFDHHSGSITVEIDEAWS